MPIRESLLWVYDLAKDSIETVLRLTVAAGTLKAGFFLHKDAFKYISRDALLKAANDDSFLAVARAKDWASAFAKLAELFKDDFEEYDHVVKSGKSES